MALKKTWVVVADQEHSRFYEVDNRDYHLRFVSEVFNEAKQNKENLRGKGVVAKRSGHSNVRALVNENSVTRRMNSRFVAQLCDHIEKSRKQNAFNKLIIVAGPELIGQIRSGLSRPTLDCVQKTLSKDYTHFTRTDVMEF